MRTGPTPPDANQQPAAEWQGPDGSEVSVDWPHEWNNRVGPHTQESSSAASDLICFNHHDYVIASGAAESWLAKRKLELERLEGDDLLENRAPEL